MHERSRGESGVASGPEADAGQGLAAVALSHVADMALPDIYNRAWSEWRDVLEDHPAEPPVAGARVLAGFGGESVPCKVDLPGGTLCAVLVWAPDADNQWRDVRALVERGIGVVQLGLRGCNAGERPNRDWACEGLREGFDRGEDAVAWRLMRATGDVASALQGAAGLGVPVHARGQSLGGGLMVLALAGLSGMPGMSRVERLVLELPGLGDWKWRWAQAAKASLRGGTAGAAEGVGGGLLEYAGRFPARRTQLYNSLRLVDAALAAPKLHLATLCKLAVSDPVVPAPAAAAVFNAIGADTGHKWRFVVPMGHSNGDLASARRHAEFEKCSLDFLDPSHSPQAGMRRWFGAPDGDAPESTLFGEGAGAATETASLIAAYEAAGRTLDDLPYTAEFDAFYESVTEGGSPSRHEVLHRLQALRKAGKLPRLGRAVSRPPAISDEDEAALAELVVGALGKLSLRDRLPYSPEFDAIVDGFNSAAGLALGPHDVWRLVAKLAK